MGRSRNRVKDFQPVLIVLQIICMQCFFYLAMGTLAALSHVIWDTPVALDHMFTDGYVNFHSWSGWSACLGNIATGVAGAYLLSIVVEKSKKCVDFTFTVYFFHIIACSIYQEFPLVWEWWLSIVVSSVIMATLGEYWCASIEMEDIPAVASAYDSAMDTATSIRI